MNPQNLDLAFAQQMKKGLILSAVLALCILSTAVIPQLKRLPEVRREEVRPAHAPNPIGIVPRMATGELRIVNFVHRAISVQGVVADQLHRLFVAGVFLCFFSLRILSSSRVVRAGLAAFSLLGAAGCLSDTVSYWLLGGVVDWIGVNGRSAFAPSDLCWCIGPLGILLIASFGLLTFNETPGAQPPQPARTAELAGCEECAPAGSL
jgi:hypothetical protein